MANVTISQLQARRTKLVGQIREAQSDAESGPGEGVMTQEQQDAFDALKVALTNLEAAIANRAAVDQLNRETRGLQIGGGSGADPFVAAARGFRIGVALGGACGLGVDDGPEREVSRELQKRSGKNIEGFLIPWQALERRVVTPAGGGAGIVGVFLDESGYTDALRAAIVMADRGAQYMSGLDTNIDLPRLSTVATAQWVADGSGITTDTSEAFDKISLRPHMLGGIVEFTRGMLITSTPAVQDACRNDLVQVLARGIDLAAIAGSGGIQPVGILNSPIGSVSMGANGAPATWAAILALIEAVQLANAPETSLGFIGNPRVKAQLMSTLKFPGSSGSVPVMDKPDELAGYPFSSTTQCPSNGAKGTGTGLSTLIFGSFSEALIALWGEGVEVLVNPYGSTQFASGNIQVRALVSADVQLRHAASFAAITDIAAA